MIGHVIKSFRGTLRSYYNGVVKLWNLNAVRTVSTKALNTQDVPTMCTKVSSKQSVRIMSTKAITVENMNQNIVRLQYAVRGPLVIRATQLEKELKQGAKKPFKHVIKANLGDAHAMGQPPITFLRQVLACLSYPPLIKKGFPDDVVDRVLEILEACGGSSIGSYSPADGIELIRRRVAKYIENRDGFPCHWENVSLTTGASTGIKNCLQLLCKDIDGKPSGVMIPIPQYPLYSAALSEYGLAAVQYYLNEDDNWALDKAELERSFCEAENCKVRALVVINPGNPTGQVLTHKNMEMIIKFARKHNLFLFADEVYQYNIHDPNVKFHSFKKVMSEMGKPYDSIELVSFMSASKSYMGECGLRGGWMEIINWDPAVRANLYKARAALLGSNTLGQAVMDCVAMAPKEGEASYELWKNEKESVLTSIQKRAKMAETAFNSMEGFKCNPVQGAMYTFPRILLPKGVIEAAKKEKKPPDVFYAFRLLEETGICVVPGSGFGQKPGTYHFRTTILPQVDLLQEMLDVFKKFHNKFTSQYK